MGTIELRSIPAGTIARGKIAEDGGFEVSTFRAGDGAVAGKHQVVIQQLIITEHLDYKAHNHGRRVPRKFADYTTSGLELEVEAIDVNHATISIVGQDKSP